MENIIVNNNTVFSPKLANTWAEFVDCPERLKTLGAFLEKNLKKHQSIILDAAMGIGCESVFLVSKGYKIISNEIDEDLIQIANQSANTHNVSLNIIQTDWRDLDVEYSNFFESIYTIGNSICLLDTINDIRMAISNFYSSLKKGGTLIIDERNFQYMLENKNNILSGNFRYSGKYIYCGKNVTGIPIVITDKNVTFGYYKNKELIGTLKMYPFKKNQLRDILFEVGFTNVEVYSDFKHDYQKQADFYTYIASK